MKTRKKIIDWAKGIDNNYADLKTKYGAFKEKENWRVNLWHPLAKKVKIIIFDKDNQDQKIREIEGNFVSPNWTWLIQENLDGFFYQYEITQANGNVTRALDPYAKSMASFNWEGKENKVGKAAFVEYPECKSLTKLNKLNNPQPIIYETHIRDLTSLTEIKNKGLFKGLQDIKLAQHLNKLGFTAIQFLPIHNCYSLNENNNKVLLKNEGSGWETNYNWGYDPHNYFSINGWYSSDPNNPYSRMNEFKETVEYIHSSNINVILDVVYNHLMTNSILDNVFPEYYFRGGSDQDAFQTPVKYPPLASSRKMCRRIIIDSLEWFVKTYDVDGFRFDLSCFTDKETIEQIAKRLRKIKPNLILHGEAWPFSDLDLKDSFIKGTTDNNIDFGYFNDSTRQAIKGDDDKDDFSIGIIGGNLEKEFDKYLSAIIGNVKEFSEAPKNMSSNIYDRFTKSANNNVQYLTCHDGHTLWDKINLTYEGNKIQKFEAYRQAILLLLSTQGRILIQGGTELLYTKPNDDSGEEKERFHQSDLVIDLFGLGNKYNENSYKTTDYTNGFRWENLEDKDIKNYIYEFIKKAILIRKSKKAFNLSKQEDIQKNINFNLVEKRKGIIDFNIIVNNKKIRIIHNLKEEDYKYATTGNVIIDSKINNNEKGVVKGNSSQFIEE